MHKNVRNRDYLVDEQAKYEDLNDILDFPGPIMLQSKRQRSAIPALYCFSNPASGLKRE